LFLRLLVSGLIKSVSAERGTIKKEVEMKRFVVWATVVSFLATPILSMAQSYKVLGDPDSVKFELPPVSPQLLYAQNTGSSTTTEGDCVEAKKAGEKEGSRETNGFAWGTMGFLLGVIGVVIAGVADPGHPSETALASSSNKTCFDDGYRGKKKSGRLTASVIGAVLWVGVYLVILSASSSDSSQ
jgi:hypothetical protein